MTPALQNLIIAARSWKTTSIGAAFGCVVAYWAFVDQSILTTEQAIGLLAIGLGANGIASKDGDKTSEAVGATTKGNQ